jgi:ring-1,2-phenylacetyl-CoA epoxidase subunit PaaE
MTLPRFHTLLVKRVEPLTADAVAITFAVPPDLRDTFDFAPGQFVTLRTVIDGMDVRRSYSLCSTPARVAVAQEITVGIKRVAGGVFSNWATQTLQAGDTMDVMVPDGRFTPRPIDKTTAPAHGMHRVAFAAGSGITPILSIMSHTLATEPASRFTLVYGNQRVGSILFNEALQDLKDQYPARVTLIHVLSRQAQDVPFLQGRIDAAKVQALLASLLPVAQINEAFICGPEGMINTVEATLLASGLTKAQVHTERFFAGDTENTTISIANYQENTGAMVPNDSQTAAQSLHVVLDGKTHALTWQPQDKLLDVALAAGLDLPYACRGGVCCTCRARVLTGSVSMEKNFTLEQWEVDKGFVLTCQARALTPEVTVSFDER